MIVQYSYRQPREISEFRVGWTDKMGGTYEWVFKVNREGIFVTLFADGEYWVD